MEELQTNLPAGETSQEGTQPQTEENTSGVPPVQKTQESQLEGDLTAGDVVDDTNTSTGDENVTQNVVDPSEEVKRLQQELDRYKAQDERFVKMAEQAGTNTKDPEIARAEMQLDIINNQAQQAYIQLCNECGVDYRPEKITESANKLLETNPKAYYDLQYKLGQLDNAVNAKRAEVDNFIAAKQREIALAQYSTVLNASPAIKQTVEHYLANNGGANAQSLMDEIMNVAKPIYQEAFEYGKLYAQQEFAKQAKPNPAQILNSSPVVNNASYTQTMATPLTMKDVEVMDVETYAKNKDLIDKLWAEGKLK